MPATLAAENVSDQTAHWIKALQAARDHEFVEAIERADAAERAGLTEAVLFYRRGRWNFRAKRVQASLKDFDRYVQLRPETANAQWERGITCYYAEKYRAGAKQFEDYQKYHDNDVENAVWRYLCQIQFDSKQVALRQMLPIKNDTRVPMMEIYALFRGQSTPAKVLALLESTPGTAEQKRQRRFDAYLYLSLYLDAENDGKQAAEYIDLAVKQYKRGDYMWAVAVVHQDQLRRRQRQPKPAAEKSTAAQDEAAQGSF